MNPQPDLPHRCADCRKLFADQAGLDMHRRNTHDNPEWVARKEVKRAHMAARPIPTCPRCGREARVDHTQFGPRATCCGLHSWGLNPLKDRVPERKAAE